MNHVTLKPLGGTKTKTQQIKQTAGSSAFPEFMAATTVTLHKEMQGGPRRHSEKYWELLAQRTGKVAKENELEEHIYPLM